MKLAEHTAFVEASDYGKWLIENVLNPAYEENMNERRKEKERTRREEEETFPVGSP